MKKIRLGIIGAGRGTSFCDVLKNLSSRISWAALCDLDEEALGKWRAKMPALKTYKDLSMMLAEDACDAVLIASPMQLHAEQALQCMAYGKHVLSEVPACVTEAEGRSLIAAARSSGVIYMMSENYCYTRWHLMMKEMIARGVFGELTYAEGMYLHDVRSLYFRKDGKLTWRGAGMGQALGNVYPTHSLGPVAWWLGIGRDDHMETLYSVSAPAAGIADFAGRVLGASHVAADRKFWGRGDSTSTIIKTAQGKVIVLRLDLSSSRPHNAMSHELQGSRGVFRSAVWEDQEPRVWLEGRSAGAVTVPAERLGSYHEPGCIWENISKYAEEFEHPLWRELGEEAHAAGHGGGDFLAIRDFVLAVQKEQPVAIDVGDAVSWSSILWWSAQSERTGEVVRLPRYEV